jgi:hypothetical protein
MVGRCVDVDRAWRTAQANGPARRWLSGTTGLGRRDPAASPHRNGGAWLDGGKVDASVRVDATKERSDG